MRQTIFGPMNFDYNSQYLSFGSTGSIGPQLTYTLEVVRETGTTLSSPFILPIIPVPQTKDSIDAWAGVFNLIYALRDRNLTNFSLTTAFGTGDPDRLTTSGTYAGNRTGTTDRAFNSLGYIYTGLAYAPDLANLGMVRVGASTAIPIDSKRPDAASCGQRLLLLQQVESAQSHQRRIGRQPLDRIRDGFQARLAYHQRCEREHQIRHLLPGQRARRTLRQGTALHLRRSQLCVLGSMFSSC